MDTHLRMSWSPDLLTICLFLNGFLKTLFKEATLRRWSVFI